MGVKYIVENPGLMYICDTLEDAQEMVLCLAEEWAYEDFAYYDNKYPGWMERMRNMRAKDRDKTNKRETFECYILNIVAGNKFYIRPGVEVKG